MGLTFVLSAQEAEVAAEPAESEYTGPAVLSRGTGPSVTSRSETIKFRPFLSLNGIYDTGLAAVSVGPNGEISTVDSFGGEAEAGVYGYKSWKRTVVGLDYRGKYRHYSPHSYYDGTDQTLDLSVSHQATRHTTFMLREAAGTFTRGFGFSNAYWLVDPLFANVPRDQLFDARVNYLSSMADLTYQKSARLSFNLGGDQFLVRFRSNAFYGMTGGRARGDVAYRYSRHGTVGVSYNFNHYSFTKSFGASDVHSVGILHSVRIGRFWEWRLKAGGARVETLGAARVELDPAIAAIIGQSVGIQAVHRLNYVPDVEARLTRSFRRASLEFSYARGISPGNGLYLTSVSETGDVAYRYTGLRKWNFGFDGGYSSYRSLALTLGKYRGYHGGAGATYQLMRALHLNIRVDGRQYNIGRLAAGGSNYDRVIYRVSAGIAFAPGDIPLALW